MKIKILFILFILIASPLFAKEPDNELISKAKEFFKKYENICSDILTYHLYQWDAMPILSILSKN